MTTQVTIDGKPAPVYKPRAKKRHIWATSHNAQNHYDYAIRQETKTNQTWAGPRTPAQERAWQEDNRLKGAKQEMACLLDWHATSPHSQVHDMKEPERYTEKDGPPEDPNDEHRILTVPPKHRETYEKRKSHYDE